MQLDWQDARLTLLYVMSPSCTWCQKNAENIKTIYRARANDYRFVGLSVTTRGLDAYRRTSGIPFPICSDLRHASGKRLALARTPETLIISPKGIVLHRWRGAYAGVIAQDIEETLGVRLPGLSESGT